MRPKAEIAAPLLVVLPSIFATLVSVRRHRFTQRMTYGVQALVMACSMSSFSAAALLAVSVPSEPKYRLWLGLSILSLVALVSIAWSLAYASWQGRQAGRSYTR